jgi:DNA repair protein RecO (recombination protein O)
MQAIILKKSVFFEGNEIVVMYTRDNGKLRAVARSVKSAKSKLAFGLQTLFHSDVELTMGKKMPTITGVRTIDTFMNFRERLEVSYLAFFASELILKSTVDEEPNPALFDFFLSYLKHLDQEEGEHFCLSAFVFQVLTLNGYGITADKCAVCEKGLGEESLLSFSNRKSGFLCQECTARTSDARTVSKNSWQFCSINEFLEQDRSLLPVGDKQALGKVAQDFATYILERNLNAAKYI